MIDILSSQASFIVVISLLLAGAIGSLVVRNNDELANGWGSFFAVSGSLWGLVFAISTLISGRDLSFVVGGSSFPLLSLSLHIDMFSAFFVFVIALIALFCSVYGFGYVKHYYKKYNIGRMGFFYNLVIASLFFIVTASNGLFFVIVWEIMSIASYFLVVYDHREKENVKAGALYLIMCYVATVCIILSFLFLFQYTGSFDFQVIRAGAAHIPLAIKNTVFVLAMIGFGIKAGVIPFHIWLPSAHPAAPSHVSALMSGVMIKTGIYMMFRIFLDLLQPVPAWWGLTLLIIGSVSSLLGVLYALTEHDLKRLLAYHSIENIGIILLGLGASLTFSSLGMPSLALLGLAASLFHTLNHATFKSLLFLSAGSVINQMHTRNMEEYGGLIKYMPQTALFFLIGSMAISALPPFNGFFSEWLTFQSLFQGIASLDFSTKWIFILAAGALAFTGGLALACFVKAFGASFLARPRSPEVAHAKESSISLRIGMGGLAVCSLLFGIFSGYLTSVFENIGKGFQIFHDTAPFVSTSAAQEITVGNGFASVSAPSLLGFFLIVLVLVVLVVKFVINKNQKVTTGATWDCGTDLGPRMEITATGFARSIILIFKGILKPSIQHEVEYHDSESRYLPKSRAVVLSVRDLYHTYLYEPLHRGVESLARRTKSIQTGNVNVYISYIFVVLIIALFLVL